MHIDLLTPPLDKSEPDMMRLYMTDEDYWKMRRLILHIETLALKEPSVLSAQLRADAKDLTSSFRQAESQKSVNGVYKGGAV